MQARSRVAMNRRAAFQIAGAAAAGAAVLAQAPKVGWAHDLRPTDPVYHFDEYERVVDRDVIVRMLYQWPTLTNPLIYANINNGLNGFQFAYDLPSDRIQVVVQAYASANLAMYDDSMWAKYRLGEIFKIQDPTTSLPAARNIWFSSKNPPTAQPPTERSDPYYSDNSIEGLQRRGVLFLICHNTIHGQAGQVSSSEQNTEHLSTDAIVADIQAHTIPGALLVPSAVGELVRLQDKGYRLVVNG
jgi:intracellular sulfur oxidation DsrE/DsrF family protein